jgi:hypothetical protein
MKARIAMYKGPASGLKNKLGHWAVCVFDTIIQSIRARRPVLVRHSHIELVVAGVCYSSSFRDGGVRSKVIHDLEMSGKWDIYDVTISDGAFLRFEEKQGWGYDWLGMTHCVPGLRWMPRFPRHTFCSEFVVWMALALPDADTYSPHSALQRLIKV